MAIRDADLWHQVHAQREDGVPATFLIREVDPRTDQPQIFVIQMPYPTTDLSTLPDAESIRRLDTFQEQWVEPACEALGWTLVAWKSEDGSFFLYLYGDGDPDALLEKLSRYDGDLGFFHDRDADWSEYAALRELVDQAQAAPDEGGEDTEGGEADHVHTAACDHDHDQLHDHGNDHDAPSHGIAVIDLTGDPPAGEAEPARPAATKSRAAKPTRARAPGVKARKARAAKAAPAKPAAAKTRATKAARTRPAKAKAASAQRAASKPTQRAASKPTQRAASKPTQRAASKPTQRAASKPTQRAAKPASSKTPARRSVAGKQSAPRTSRR
jgi:hypothetical protein